MPDAVHVDGRTLIPVGIGFMDGAYVLVSEAETYLLFPEPIGAGYRLRAKARRWERYFSSLQVAVAYVNAIECPRNVPYYAA